MNAIEWALHQLYDACGDLERSIQQTQSVDEALAIQRQIGEAIELLRSTARTAIQRQDELKTEYVPLPARQQGEQ